MNSRISVVINTLNEERNLANALRSVRAWAHEIIVVDMHSVDRTVEIARQFDAKVYLHDGPGFNYPPRQYAVSLANEPWIFVLDADELVPPALSRELHLLVEKGDSDVVYIPRLNYLLGQAVLNARWGPDEDSQLRFFRKEKILASSIAHQDFLPTKDAVCGRIKFDGSNAIVHFAYFDSAHFIERLNRYTNIEAEQRHERCSRSSIFMAMAYAGKEFFSRYIMAKGFRDGWRGFYLSLYMSFYRIAVAAKQKELEVNGHRADVMNYYREQAEFVLKGYEADRIPDRTVTLGDSAQ